VETLVSRIFGFDPGAIRSGANSAARDLARKIRERSIRHVISYRMEKTRAGTLSAHPGYGCRCGENGRGGSNGETTEMSVDPHAVIVWGGCPETGILTRFRTSSEAVATYKLCYSTSGISGLSQEACYPKSLSGKACKGETFRRMENIRRKRTSTPPSGGGFSDWIDGVDWIDCVDRGQNGHG